MAEKIRDNLYRLEIPLVGNPLKTLNSYLITGERNLLIDTGFRQDPCREAMLRELAVCGAEPEKTDIFLTHLHSDHTGLSTELHRPGCRIYISAIDGGALLRHSDRVWEARYGDMMKEGFSEEEMGAMAGSNPAQTMAAQRFEDYTLLQDGDVLDYGGYHLTCVLTPGHSPGHMCLHEAEQKILFSGDHVLFHITPNITRWAEMEDALGSYLQSLRRTRSLETELLLPAHREETGDLKQRTDELLAHHQRRLDNTLRVVREMPGMTAYQIAGAMRWQIRCRSWEDFPLTQKFFAVGEALSHLDHLAKQGLLRREEDEYGKFHWYPCGE